MLKIPDKRFSTDEAHFSLVDTNQHTFSVWTENEYCSVFDPSAV